MKLKLFLFFIFNSVNVFSQSHSYRYYHHHEISLNGRFEKEYQDFFPSIGYEYSFNKNKAYLSLANEFIAPLSKYTNYGNSLMSIFKINYQRRDITFLGIGLKQNFSIKQTNFVAIGGYKYDFSKYKLTFSAHFLVERYKISLSNPVGTSTCIRSCPTHSLTWSFGVSAGKYL